MSKIFFPDPCIVQINFFVHYIDTRFFDYFPVFLIINTSQPPATVMAFLVWVKDYASVCGP